MKHFLSLALVLCSLPATAAPAPRAFRPFHIEASLIQSVDQTLTPIAEAAGRINISELDVNYAWRKRLEILLTELKDSIQRERQLGSQLRHADSLRIAVFWTLGVSEVHARTGAFLDELHEAEQDTYYGGDESMHKTVEPLMLEF
ncbi:MAG TPA: hypothetical protein VEZ11_17335, partial [Thermoanaerobaculia bacterium]|nr:hypothetical protein [Thermoanaerobaculia bacterium]